MKAEIVIALSSPEEGDLSNELQSLLGQVLIDKENDFDATAIQSMIQVAYKCDTAGDRPVLGIHIDLPEETNLPGLVVNEFCASLSEFEGVLHLSCFEDEYLLTELQEFGATLFALEMKIRRVLSIVYLRSPMGNHPYAMLRNDRQRTQTKDLTEQSMRAHYENQLFHVGFTQYAGLNTPRLLDAPALVDLIQQSDNYDDLRTAVTRQPVQREKDELVIAGLRERMETLEAMRNCVAHNRRPAEKLRQNFPVAAADVEALLESYLSTLPEEVGEADYEDAGAPSDS